MMQGSHHPLGAAVRATAHLTPRGQREAWALQAGIAEWALEGTWLHLQRQLVTEPWADGPSFLRRPPRHPPLLLPVPREPAASANPAT